MGKKEVVYEYKTKSLREHLVTLPEFIDQVKHAETTDISVLGVGIHNDYFDMEQATNVYVAPYIWDKPAYLSVVASRGEDAPDEVTEDDLKSMSHEEVQMWVNKISERVGPYLAHAIPEEMVNYFDNHPSLGIILHNLTGEVIPFNYDYLKSIDFISYDVLNISFLIRLYLNNRVLDDSEDLVEKIQNQEEPYKTLNMIMGSYESRLRANIPDPLDIRCVLNYDGGDDIRDNTDMKDYHNHIIFTVTSSSFIGNDQRDSLFKYMNVMIKNHAKVLVIT